jgi:hypothetical protein
MILDSETRWANRAKTNQVNVHNSSDGWVKTEKIGDKKDKVQSKSQSAQLGAKFNLFAVDTDDKRVEAFASHSGIRAKSVSLKNCERITNRSLVLLARHCPNIRKFYCSGCPRITDQGVKAVIGACRHLQFIYISDNDKLTKACFKNIAHNCRHLPKVYLASADAEVQASIVHMISTATNLQLAR